MQRSFYVRRGKRWCDIAASSVGLVLLSPLLLVCSLLVRLSSPGPVFFRQARTGRDGRHFRIYKFRTMFGGRTKEASLLTASGDARITPLGRWLRKAKVDELPQLFNVITGEMSLVGPRPEVPLYTDLYTPLQRAVLSVRPGITGLASISFSAEETLLAAQADAHQFYVSTLMPYKIGLELEYCRRITFIGDFRLLLQTFLKLFGISNPPVLLSKDIPGIRS